MNIRSLLFALPLLLSAIPLAAQNAGDFYTQHWAEVHQYELAQLPKSALEVVNDISERAKKENNTPQAIKALIYQSKFALILEEDAQLNVVRKFTSEIVSAETPRKNLLESLLADIYWQYFQRNRWQFYERTRTEEKVDSLDFRTWDLQTLFSEIHRHFQRSLQNSDLLHEIDISTVDILLEKGEFSETYRPTLYDLLAQNALNFYKTDETHLSKPALTFDLDEERYFGDLSDITIETPDNLSLQFHALKLYQSLINIHRNDQDPSAYVQIQVERLRFVTANSHLENKRSLQQQALSELLGRFSGHPSSTLIEFEEASLLYIQSTEDQKDSTGLKGKALAICEEAIERFPESRGAEQCLALKEQILAPSLELMMEKYVPVNSPSRILVTYKNIGRLSFATYTFTSDQKARWNDPRTSNAGRVELLNELQSVLRWEAQLPDKQDYEEHSTEVVVPAYPTGEYLLVAHRTDTLLSDDELLAYSFLQVTNLALIENTLEEAHRFQVVDRNTGKSLAGASVRMTNEKGYGKRLDKRFTTDENGFISIKQTEYYNNVEAEVTFGKDKALFGNYYFYDYREPDQQDEEYISAKAFLFTDRSIYRPGQTVYFKGILIRSDLQKTAILPGEYVEVYLEDVNGEEVGSQRLQTTEYGSFSGKFKLPATGITGQYTLHTDQDYEEDSKFYDELMDDFEPQEYTISVEEYKRPKFEVTFDPVKETYRVNDTLSVIGSAQAFSGTSISQANVAYRIHRQIRFPVWYYWGQPSRHYYSEPQEIAHGEIMTDNEGRFTIHFTAIPDEGVSPADLPVFNYEITADVTDINGETRSETIIVNVGYHTLELDISLPEEVNRNRDYTLNLSSKNLNGEAVPATGRLQIFKLKAPEHPLRERAWTAPDSPIMTEASFKKLFPHEPYTDVPETGKKSHLVFETAFDTEKSGEIKLDVQKSWALGGYLIEVRSEDRFGQEVIGKKRFTLTDPKSKTVPDNQLFLFQADKNQYQVGETVRLKIGSASENLTAVIDIEKKGRIVKTHVVSLSNEVKTLDIPVTPEDADGFAIQYSYVNYNYFQGNSYAVPVTAPSEELTIETSTFRDRIQPGVEETWSFEIKGAKKEKAEAEVLASMYDASLDQFRSHAWAFNPDPQNRYYSYNHSNAYQSFGNTYFTRRNQPRIYYSAPQLRFDRLNWFGFSLANSDYVNQQYLRQLAYTYTSHIRSEHDPAGKKGYVYGTVLSPEGEPMPGVSVLVKGTNRGTVSDIDGNYSIQAKPGEELVFSFVGYETSITEIGKNNTINVRLAEDIQALSEVVVVGYGEKKMELVIEATEETVIEDIVFAEAPQEDLAFNMQGKAAGVALRGNVSLADQADVSLIVIDGVIVDALTVTQEQIAGAQLLKGDAAVALYGARAANGVLIITTKEGQKKMDQELATVQARTNLKETAFFFPHLTTDKDGKVSFTFTTPEALTRWKLQLLAHTKNLASQTKTLQTITQKDLMVIPNPPRFLRQGDTIIFSTKLSNLTSETLQGAVALQLFDAVSGEPVDSLFGHYIRNKNFTVNAKGNSEVSWKLNIPETVEALQYRVVAKAGDFSDGEQNALPILTNRTLVTETLPMNVRAGETKTFVLDKLKNVSSPTLQHHQLTLEVTSNPAWYAIRSLPYLIEFPYECSEQIFSRYYANRIGNHIVSSNPKIKAVFDQWDSKEALVSNLEKNEELKSIIIQETPWLREAQSESEQKQRLAALFDLSKLDEGLKTALNKLEQMQMNGGGFPWFTGSRYPNRYITQHIAAGFGHLKQLGIPEDEKATKVIRDAISYLDQEVLNDYEELLKRANLEEDDEFMEKQRPQDIHVHYLYTRSFYPELEISKKVEEARSYYQKQAAKYWSEHSLYLKGMIALVSHRTGDGKVAGDILRSLRETSIQSEELGMYWKANQPSWWWNEAPIETQALLIEAFSEIEGTEDTATTKTVDELKIWLLKNKQTNQWSTTKATTEAVYALLLQGTDWLSIEENVAIEVGDRKVVPGDTPEAGTGYFKTTWDGSAITTEMAEVTMTKKEAGIAWGSLYWQYFEDLDKITTAETPLKLSKKLFLVKNTDRGQVLTMITDTTSLQLGNLVRVRIELRSDRDMEFVHMKDMRASGLEPVNVLSEYKWQDGLGYYESTRDASTNFFFDFLPKGVYVFEYDLRVNNRGDFSNGITTIQSMYAPEFSSHSEGVRIGVE